MNHAARGSLNKSLFFTSEEVADLFGVTRASGQVFCSRQVKNGAFIRLKKDFYVSEARWPYLDQLGLFRIANHLQVPSYISCTSALVYHGVTTQAPLDWYESVALKRSIQYAARGTTFSYYKVKKDYYFGFTKIGSFFMAQKEKALLDACHLSVHGNFAFDQAALDLDRIDRAVMETMMAPFPKRTRNKVNEILGAG